MAAPQPILSLNSGSSSLKFALHRIGPDQEDALASGAVDGIGLPNARLVIRRASEHAAEEQSISCTDHHAAVRLAFDTLSRFTLPVPVAVGHRLVHGGPHHAEPERITPELLETLRRAIPFAPLHQPGGLAGIEAAMKALPGVPQVACFDTAFHRRLPETAQRFPLPQSYWDEGLRRYGFHGLSYESVLHTLGLAGQGRVVIAHLGNGASVTAIRDGRPLETTMGLTPTSGIMMGTRSGDLDPGLLIYLMRVKGYDAQHIEQLVNEEAGLRGVSGVSHDMRILLEQRVHDPRAALAITMFCDAVRKSIGAMAAVLDGMDLLIFTGGIGEHVAVIRWEICRGLSHLGIILDEQRNHAGTDPIHRQESRCAVRIIPAREELMIARHTYALLNAPAIMYDQPR